MDRDPDGAGPGRPDDRTRRSGRPRLRRRGHDGRSAFRGSRSHHRGRGPRPGQGADAGRLPQAVGHAGLRAPSRPAGGRSGHGGRPATLARHSAQMRRRIADARLKALDLSHPRQGDINLVLAFQQLDLVGRADVERPDSPARRHRLIRQADAEKRRRRMARQVHQRQAVGLRQDQRKNAVLQAVVAEDVGEAGGDDAADAEIRQGPGRVLAAGAAAEIIQRDQHPRLVPRRLIQNEVRTRPIIRVEPQGMQQDAPQPGPRHALQKAAGDQFIGVDIGDGQGRRDGVQGDERLHQTRLRTSTSRPATAAAAAIDGDTRWPLGLGRRLDVTGARHDQGAHALGDMTAARDDSGGAQILKPAVGAAADEDGVDGQTVQRLIRRQPHIGQHLFDLCAPPDVAQGAQVGGPAANGCHRLGTAAPCDHRLDGGGVDAHHLVVGRARIAGQGTPVGDRRLEGRASRRMGAAFQPGEGRLVRGDQAGAGARLDRHVADGHPPRHVQVADGLTGVFDDEAGRPIGADPADDRQNQILGRDPETERPLHLDQHRSGALLHQGLGRQNMFDLGGADAEGQGAEGTGRQRGRCPGRCYPTESTAGRTRRRWSATARSAPGFRDRGFRQPGSESEHCGRPWSGFGMAHERQCRADAGPRRPGGW
uniref:BZIP domain-containing protein n=1 Tax=Parastrongyloides trichosuri TaxID=131310 RepID=A0A0N4Z3R2_PARTI